MEKFSLARLPAMGKRGEAKKSRPFPEYAIDLLRLPSGVGAIDPSRAVLVGDAGVPVSQLARDIGRIDAADQRGGGERRPRAIGIALADLQRLERGLKISLHRRLQRHGISRLPEVTGDKEPKKKFKTYPIGYFHIDIAEVRTAEGKPHLCVAPLLARFSRQHRGSWH